MGSLVSTDGNHKRTVFSLLLRLKASEEEQNRMKRTAAEKRRALEKQFGSAPKWGSNRFLRSLYWACRGFQYWLCFYDDDIEVDVEDLLSNPFITQPPSLEQLQAVTGFQKEWIMFIYRNFKQRCSNGRMSQTQWRRIFRIIFPNASDNEFVDRLFAAVASDNVRRSLTFEDLIMCLYELTQYSDLPADTPSSSSASYSSNTVEFVFRLMKPDHNGAVSLQAFTEYVQCVFNLNSTTSSNVSNAHAISQMHTSSQQLSPSDETRAKISPGIRNYALQQFKILDADGDGFIRLCDIERALMNTGCDLLRLTTTSHLPG